MKRGDAPDLEAGDVNSHPQDTTWRRQLFEWVFSDDLAHAHATYLIERQRTKTATATAVGP